MKTLAFHYLKLVLFAAIVLSACSINTKKDSKIEVSAPNTTGDKTTSASIEAKLAAAQEGSSRVTEIEFEKTSATVSEANTAKILKEIKETAAKEKITHITVVAWSDFEMPTKDQEDRGAESIKLAQARADGIMHLIQNNAPGFGVSTVNMAKKPSKLSKFFKSSSTRIQQALRIAGNGDPKARHAIVIIEND